MKEIEFTVKCKMSEEHKDSFLSFLKKLERNGDVGHSGFVAYFADGDGTFRPKFECDESVNIQKIKNFDDVMFDSGNFDGYYGQAV